MYNIAEYNFAEYNSCVLVKLFSYFTIAVGKGNNTRDISNTDAQRKVGTRKNKFVDQ